MPAFTPGWQSTALPLTSLNDDQTPPFPAATAVPGTFTDATPPKSSLVLYRVLLTGDVGIGNVLRVTKSAGGAAVSLAF